jgi:hypothetical protein
VKSQKIGKIMNKWLANGIGILGKHRRELFTSNRDRNNLHLKAYNNNAARFLS